MVDPEAGWQVRRDSRLLNHTWFRLEREGVYRGQCAELCGRNHADMLAQVRGVSPAAYATWVARQKRLIGAARDAVSHARRLLSPEEP